VLGTGYNGAVVLATCRGSGRVVAVKTLQLKGLDAAQINELRSEAEIFLSMDHPHIARLVDVFETKERLDLVMELMDGGELLDRVIELQRFAEADAADAIYQMLLAVNYMHDRHVVHCDLKLENFLYAHPGSDELKLIDFGFSYFWDSNTAKPSGYTLAYTAPEVIAGGYTSKCDLWSLGVIAFILIFGYMPFDELKVECIKKGQWLDKPEKWDGVSDMAKEFVKQLLVVDPSERLSAVEALEHPFIKNRGGSKGRCGVQSGSNSLPGAGVVDALRSFGKASSFRRACMKVMAWSLTEQERALVDDAFFAMDVTQNGMITSQDLQTLRKTLALDVEHVETMHYTEFLAAMVSTLIPMHEGLIKAAFGHFDVNKSNFITVDDFREVLGDSFDGAEIENLITEAGFQHYSKISYNDFLQYLQGPDVTASEKLTRCISEEFEKQSKKRYPLPEASRGCFAGLRALIWPVRP
jgi:serine/threonine protein kinase